MNKVSLVGRLGQDPEKKENRVKFSVATNDGYGEKKKTNWHNCTAFGKQAEIIGEFVGKGDMIAISGHIDYYTGNNGATYTNIIVDSFTLLGSKKSEQTQKSTTFPNTPVGHIEEKDDLPF